MTMMYLTTTSTVLVAAMTLLTTAPSSSVAAASVAQGFYAEGKLNLDMNSNRVATTIKLLYRCVPMFLSLALTLSLLSIVSFVCYYMKIKNRLNKPNETKPNQTKTKQT